MAFTSLTAAQVDADSPINETLMDLIRTNLDDLDTRMSALGGEGIKGWAHIDGNSSPASLLDSFNVVSVTDNGLGDYTFIWDTDFANANYAVSAGVSSTGGGAALVSSFLNYAVGSVDIKTVTRAAGSAGDPTDLCIIAIGDQ